MIADSLPPPQFYLQGTNRCTDNSYGYRIYFSMIKRPNFFWFEGMGLQIVMINPKTETIIVRLGGIQSLFNSAFERPMKAVDAEIIELFLEANQ